MCCASVGCFHCCIEHSTLMRKENIEICVWYLRHWFVYQAPLNSLSVLVTVVTHCLWLCSIGTSESIFSLLSLSSYLYKNSSFTEKVRWLMTLIDLIHPLQQYASHVSSQSIYVCKYDHDRITTHSMKFYALFSAYTFTAHIYIFNKN